MGPSLANQCKVFPPAVPKSSVFFYNVGQAATRTLRLSLREALLWKGIVSQLDDPTAMQMSDD